MDAFMEEFQHLKIQLEEIQSATDNFSENNIIGRGGFGNVYKGVIPSKEQNVVAIKRLNSKHGQGNTEFWREITMLSRYTHENLISLVGFCDEGGEKILIYEHAYHGSLDRHLSSTSLTWIQRIEICLDAARGLSFLHDDKGTQQRVLHRDIKSSNILLDENWKAKVSDMGLSKIGPSNQLHTVIVTDVVGTYGYLDPLYMETGILSKESDVYSFGVVLFEVLCGKLCYETQNKILVRIWKQSYKQNHLSDIIFQDLAQQINPDALETFSEIAFQCLQKSRDKRPTMSDVVEKLESALDSQEGGAVEFGKEMLKYYKEIAGTAVPPLKYRSKRELRLLLSNGVLLNGGKTRFSLDNNGNHCEMIFIEEERLSRHASPYEEVQQMYDSQNSRYVEYTHEGEESLRTYVHVRAQFLSPLITYTTNLVVKASNLSEDLIDISSYLRYMLVGETGYLNTQPASKREDGTMMVELCQFTNDGRTVDLEIEFELSFPSSWEVVLEGIEFRPLEKVEHKVLEHEKVDAPYLSDSDTYWEQILPNDYQEILKWSEFPIRWTTKKELYVELCKGFLMNNDREWFSLNKNGKKCHMLSAKACVPNVTTFFSGESRFREKVFITGRCFQIVSEIRSQVLSPETTYATYLVYQIIYYSNYEPPISVIDKHLPALYLNANRRYIYLRSPRVPVIRRKVDENTYNPVNSPKLVKGFPQQRSDGLMEVQVWEFQTGTTPKIIPISLELEAYRENFTTQYTLIVLGIEFRPI